MENKGNKRLKKKPWEVRIPMKGDFLKLKTCEVLKKLEYKYCLDSGNVGCYDLEKEILLKCPR